MSSFTELKTHSYKIIIIIIIFDPKKGTTIPKKGKEKQPRK